MSSSKQAAEFDDLAEPSGRPGVATNASLATSVQMAVRSQIRREILNGTLPASTRLQQADLSKQYGVSITPIREALRDLAADGLVDISPFSGARVHTTTLKEFGDIYQVRAELMPLTIQMSVQNIGEEELARADELIRLMDQPSATDSWVELNAEFHHILEGACQNARLAKIMDRLADVNRVYVAMCERVTPRAGRANEVHKEILEAYKDRDVDRAIDLSLRHITETLEVGYGAFRQARVDAKKRNDISRRRSGGNSSL